MNDGYGNIDILIAKYLSGNASPGEVQWLDNWEAESEKNRQIFIKSREAWEKSQTRLDEDSARVDKVNIQKEIDKQQFLQIRKIKRQISLYKIAAILALPIAFAISLYISDSAIFRKAPEYCQVSAPKGHVSKCTLPDGTEVWVNTGSSITYDILSFNKKSREVKIEGEAYFQVAKNRNKPFRVLSPLADIEVTGTAFNVKTLPGTGLFEAVLAEGRIRLNLKQQNNPPLVLKPGERILFDKSKSKAFIENVDAEMFSCWRNGEIIFKDATLNDLIVELERIYDIRFHLNDRELGNYRFRGMFSYNNNLLDALEKIRRTADIDYYIENKEIWLSRK